MNLKKLRVYRIKNIYLGNSFSEELKKIALICILISVIFCNAQKATSVVDHRIKFSSTEGYNIINPSAAAFDRFGWLWIAGNNVTNEDYFFESRQIIIQRFDGTNFFNVELPEFSDKIFTVFLHNNEPDGILARFVFEDYSSELYSIDPETLHFSKIDKDLPWNKTIKWKAMINLNGQITFVAKSNKDELILIQYKDNEARITDKVPYTQNRTLACEMCLSHRGPYTVLSIDKREHYLVSEDGVFIKQLTEEDIDFIPPTSLENIGALGYKYHENGTAIFSDYNLNKPNNYFELDEKNLRLKQISIIKQFEDKEFLWSDSNKTHLFILENQEEGDRLEVYDANNKNLFESFIFDGFDQIAYRDLDKELIILHGNTLERLLFNQNNIKTFLKGKSIRAIAEIGDNRYIISTDDKGIYEINTLTGVSKKIAFTLDGNEIPITQPREIIKTQSGYIFNDKSKLYEVDFNYVVQKVHNFSYWCEETIQVGDTIYRGAVHHTGITKFSTRSKEKVKMESYPYLVREFATDGQNLYWVSVNEGFFTYENGELQRFLPKDESAQDLLSIYYHKNLGVLVSTKNGKIYAFDTNKKTFTLIYQDDVNASIVGMIEDNSGLLWINTYAGIVSYNLENKKSSRYTKQDGVFELEGNRYSSFKDSKGNIFMGSYKGLSVFNPDELVKTRKELSLRFSELSFFDKKQDEWKIHRDLKYINSLKEIVLPSFNQRFSARVKLEDILNHKDYKFRYRLLSNSSDEEAEWNPLYLDNEIVFSNLSAGVYNLQIQAVSTINKNLGKTLELNIISDKIFYQKAWFVVLTLLAILSLFIYFFYQFVSKQKLYAQNQIAVNEAKIKEVMMLEIHHRIKNNLQVVSGLLSIQAFNSPNPELKLKLQDSQNRIESIAKIHNILYKGDNQEEIDVEEYFQDIISYNKELFLTPITFKTNVDDVSLSMDKAIPMALILNELINNSYRHAFYEIDSPVVEFSLKKISGEYWFQYQDNGVFSETKEKRVSMGMKIVHMMINQLNGKVEIHTQSNFQISIKFPLV